jgi:CxxC-x17-CxxC domain-containing protein
MHTHYVDQTLLCRDCGAEFVWSAGEQEFFAEKGFQHAPLRCRTCRAHARAARSATSGERGARVMFAVICDRCGRQAQVPFSPRQDRPVYCSSCYDVVRAERAAL